MKLHDFKVFGAKSKFKYSPPLDFLVFALSFQSHSSVFTNKLLCR